jgi:hypothetical protein
MSAQRLILGRFATEFIDEALIGQGSMGDVYLGIDIETEQSVAIKVLKRDVVRRNPDVVERFLREGEALRQLNHPNIVELLGAEERDGRYYLVMGYASGGSVQDILDRQSRLPLTKVLRLGLELADALTRAHHLGIIHRDLKPANILLDEAGAVRLTDFGMARMLDRSGLTDSDVVVGTIKYLSPEACNGQPLDNRADIWALGVVLFELLAGRPPFVGDNVGATLNSILTQPVPDLLELRPDVPVELAQLISHMLRKERDRRLSSVRQVGATLEMIAAEVKENGRPMTLPTETRAGVLPVPAPRAAVKGHGQAKRSSDQLILLEKVGRFWVQGVLARAAEQAGLIRLTRRRYDQAVDHPWQDSLGRDYYQQNQGEEDAGTIEAVYQAADRALLILGEAGAGKTTTLIALAEQLLAAAEQDRERPLPVILNLVSWAERRPLIEEWVVAELQAKYQIPRALGQKWLEANELALLLDGLDELPAGVQPDCIEAINRFRQEHGLTGIVVCCRLDAYEANPARLKFSGAVRLDPLTVEQVNAYLEQAGAAYAGLRQALRRDEVLAEMARSPLMLSVMCLAYEEAGSGTGDLAITILKPGQGEGVSAEAHRQQVFAAYVARMFQRRVADDRFSAEETRGWLAWLAQKMTAHHQTVFLIEQMQPDWLPPGLGRWGYLLLSRLLAGIGVGLFVSLYRFDFRFVLVGVLLGPVLAAVHGLLFERQAGADRLPKGVVNVGVGLLGGVLTALFFWLTDAAVTPATALYWGLLNGIGLGLANGLVFGTSYSDDIKTVELLEWDWRQGVKAILPALALAVPLGLLGGVAFGFTDSQRWALAAEIGLAFALFGGLSGSRLERTSRPNEGIRLSVRNAVGASVLFGLVMGLLLTILSGPIFGLRRLVQFGLGAAMGYGGLNVANHFILRFLLWRRREIPYHFIGFLDHAAGMVFLHKVGGGYIFIHRLLQEYFGEEEKGDPPG